MQFYCLSSRHFVINALSVCNYLAWERIIKAYTLYSRTCTRTNKIIADLVHADYHWMSAQNGASNKKQCDAILREKKTSHVAYFVMYCMCGGLCLMARKAKAIKWYTHFYVLATAGCGGVFPVDMCWKSRQFWKYLPLKSDKWSFNAEALIDTLEHIIRVKVTRNYGTFKFVESSCVELSKHKTQYIK